ncbi:hypothetical protein HYH03_019038 [Edaphochlamys debaryana]|uniref:Isochorismatase-like domain-containing protein n=1 Tax=Edaphochlamys debaryana TaxID=47281 RepID=A0A835XKL4_9CHLO|nr:hypothetical protein HYH03_019038 [Edaphochlamys debaryana]|eukprot:KAG2482014.1 hypothetical protein HYH03_019038 [Edaphochlamys debaryana]
MAYYRPQKHLREVPITDPKSAAVLFIDTQNFNCHRDGAIYKTDDGEARAEDPGVAYFFERLESVCVPAWVALRRACREAGVEVMYTVIQSLTRDGRDRSLDYVISGFHVPPGCWDAQVIQPLAPGPDEVVLPKTSSSVFNSTNIDFVLRSMGVRHLLLAGCVTDQCVAHAAMDACDLGYLVTLVPEATATYSEGRQRAALSAVSGYCRQRSVAELEAELAAAAAAAAGGQAAAAAAAPAGTGEKAAAEAAGR